MKIIKSIYTAVIFTLLATSTSFGQTQAERIDSLIQTAHQQGFFNGNILVMKKREVIYQNEIGYADASKTTSLAPHLRFNIGSISKEFDAVGIMMLAEQGKLKLSDPISKFIRDLPAWSGKVSVKHLLQYTSGLPKVEYDRAKPYTDADAWSLLKALQNVEFEPGSGYIYSNFNVFLRKRIIEEVSGQSYGEFLRTQVFEPSKMKGAVVDPAPDSPRLAMAFDNKFIEDNFPEFMSGSVYLTVHDLYQWTRHLHTYRIINKASLLRLFEGYESKESSLGVGVIEDNELVIHWNSGSSYNFESSIYVNLQDDITVILMTNNKNFNVGGLTIAIDAILRDEPFEIPKKSLYMALRTEMYYNGFDSGKKLFAHIQNYEKELYDSNIEKAIEKTSSYLLGTGKVEDGIKLLSFALTEYPDSPDLFLALGDAYLNQGNKERALENYEKARKLNPTNVRIQTKVNEIKAKN